MLRYSDSNPEQFRSGEKLACSRQYITASGDNMKEGEFCAAVFPSILIFFGSIFSGLSYADYAKSGHWNFVVVYSYGNNELIAELVKLWESMPWLRSTELNKLKVKTFLLRLSNCFAHIKRCLHVVITSKSLWMSGIRSQSQATLV